MVTALANGRSKLETEEENNMIINGTNFLLGCDPEVFVVDANGVPVSAHGMIPGTKDAPHPVDGGMIQVDGLAVEFGIDPAATEDEFFNNIQRVLAQLEGHLPAGHKLWFSPIAEFSQEHMDAQPPEALELGCDPDFNARTLKMNPRPNAAGLLRRSAGGHIHVGWGSGLPTFSEQHLEACAAMALAMDYYVGLSSMVWDKNSLRRSLYGKSSCMRPKPYGFEYRTPSNQWVKTEELIRFVYRATIMAIRSVMDNTSLGMSPRSFYNNRYSLSPQDAIDHNFSILARQPYEEVLRNVQ